MQGLVPVKMADKLLVLGVVDQRKLGFELLDHVLAKGEVRAHAHLVDLQDLECELFRGWVLHLQR